ncbi:uncharacterized protein [Musca autumnalis]|uniref:uncharacterized protein n=1 Tax=Musca autumnalis TaxID=221902 RepID=UPI003CF0C858
MKKKNFFEDPKGILEEIKRQPRLLQQQQQYQQQQDDQEQDMEQQQVPPPQMLPQQRRRLSTFTASSMVQPLSSTSLATATPSPLAYPSTSSLGSSEPTIQQPIMTAMNRRPKPGILRLDMSKPRRSSGGSVEFRMHPHMFGTNTSTPTGTTPPPHQLSVTWATPPCGSNSKEFKGKPGTPLPGAISAGAVAPASGVELSSTK